MNQIVLAHELRHALQDQYADSRRAASTTTSRTSTTGASRGLSLLEGDATLVMERFVRLRLGALGRRRRARRRGRGRRRRSGAPRARSTCPGAPPVVRDQLVQPYLAGLAFARALWARGGPEALRDAWAKPPASMEQVLHPARFFAGEAPRAVSPALDAPRGATARLRGRPRASCSCARCSATAARRRPRAGAATAGGSGTSAAGRCSRGAASGTRPRDADEFGPALRARFARPAGGPAREGWDVFAAPGGRAFALRREGDAIALAVGRRRGRSSAEVLAREGAAADAGPAMPLAPRLTSRRVG